MKKVLLLNLLIVITLLIAACSSKPVTMQNIDKHLNKENAIYIDLRSFDEVEEFGYIDGFTILPFYEILEVEGILVRSNGWRFTPNDIWRASALRELFDESKTIYIMCRSGNRSEYVYQALKHLGYEDIHNVGGIIDYRGSNLITN
ncbi:rhodanese-like domain-containing protein [Liberiplasma polymorphum]|uniref:rhodanese-like domain-containing protein n=1 Tax=Liberiplasma polymorphum TaxID=3374570 RepID=UPI003771A366